METSSGNSISSSKIGGGCDDDDQRKRKRMQSNRESARRSRMRKQKHLDELMSQVNQIKKQNHQMMLNLSMSNQQYMNVEAENCVLKAQMYELTQRLESLNNIIEFVDTAGSTRFEIGGVVDYGVGKFDDDFVQTDFINIWNNNSNMGYMNHQTIMASSDLFEY